MEMNSLEITMNSLAYKLVFNRSGRTHTTMRRMEMIVFSVIWSELNLQHIKVNLCAFSGGFFAFYQALENDIPSFWFCLLPPAKYFMVCFLNLILILSTEKFYDKRMCISWITNEIRLRAGVTVCLFSIPRSTLATKWRNSRLCARVWGGYGSNLEESLPMQNSIDALPVLSFGTSELSSNLNRTNARQYQWGNHLSYSQNICCLTQSNVKYDYPNKLKTEYEYSEIKSLIIYSNSKLFGNTVHLHCLSSRREIILIDSSPKTKHK